jgi:hypothetical protein
MAVYVVIIVHTNRPIRSQPLMAQVFSRLDAQTKEAKTAELRIS